MSPSRLRANSGLCNNVTIIQLYMIMNCIPGLSEDSPGCDRLTLDPTAAGRSAGSSAEPGPDDAGLALLSD